MANCKFIFSIVSMIFLSSVNGQILRDHEARRLVKDSKKIWINKNDSSFKFIEFQLSERKERLIDKIKLEEELKLATGSTFSKIDKSTDHLGFEHIRQQQYYSGIPVEGAIYKLHGKGGSVTKANGVYHNINNLDVKPQINEVLAYTKAIKFTDNVLSNWKTALKSRSIGKLVVLPLDNKYVLAYKFDIYSYKPLSRNYVYVDASNGEIIKVEDRLRMEDAPGIAITKYHSSQNINTEKYNNSYRLFENSRGEGIQTLNMTKLESYTHAVDFTDADNYWNSSANQDDAATSIHYSIEKAYDFFLNRFERNSFNNYGAVIQSYVHYDTAYNNAFWDGDQLFFGDGDGKNYSAFASTDVVAHEYTHAITDYTANLEYLGESGALNESFSDIFGVAVDFYANPSSANFIIGDQISISGNGIRNMGNPNQMNDPDTYMGQYWYTGTNNSTVVHTNCGVQNFWFYLLSNGGAGVNDLGKTYSVSAIGIDKATAIAYRNLTVYLSAKSGYEDARFYSIQSAIDLYGQCSNEVIAVTNAWYAVGVGEAFSSDINAQFEISQPSACSLPFVVNFKNISSNATTYSWDFGDGSVSNVTNPSHTYTQTGIYSVKLIANGNQLCNVPDTIIKQDLISISSGELLASVCQPNTINPSSVGILNFTLNEINNSSKLSKDEGGYVDISCYAQTNLIAGHIIPVSVTTNPDTDESVRIWIDINNDGAFAESEKVFSSNAQTGQHTGSFIVPVPTVYNSLLRLRVISDRSTLNIQSACFEIQAGQAEDYAVYIQPNNEKPVADFNASKSVFITGDSVSFNNLSLNIPESYEWSFPGGSPSFSSQKNPKVVYSIPGDYNVILKVRNTNGEDTKTIERIVKVRNPLNIGSDKSSSETIGLLFDSGGPNGKYSNKENTGFLVSIPCASEIRITFQMSDLENGSDLVFIYEGADQTGKLLYPLAGLTKYDTLVSKSASTYIHFTSDGSVVKKGFAIEWTSKDAGNGSVEADFSIAAVTVSTNEVISFNNISSTNSNSWFWDFNDGGYSTNQHPSHSYSEPGLKNIRLIASNCYTSDTIIKQLIVIPATIPYNISIPDQIISLDEMRVIDLVDFDFNFTAQSAEIEVINSDNEILYAAVNNYQLYIHPMSHGESVITLNITENNILVSDTFKVIVVDDRLDDIENKPDQKLRTYPNPVSDKLYIDLDIELASQYQFSVYTLAGQLVMNSFCDFSESTLEFSVENLHAGLYLIELKSNNQKYQSKFIKQ